MHYLLLANLPSPTSKLFGVNRLLSFKLAPFGVCIIKSILPCLPLNDVAKVVQISETCKHLPK